MPTGQPCEAGLDLPLVIGRVRWERGASLTSYCDPTLKGQLFHIAIAETEAGVEPGPMTDGLPREPMTLIQVRWEWCGHAASMPHETAAEKRDG
jgi:hypothetical protein